MAIQERSQPVKLIVAVMFSRQDLFDRVLGELEQYYGPADSVSPPIQIPEYTFYEAEMGAGLMKKIVAFENLFDAERLASVKTHTISIEHVFSVDGRRSINLDPGYLTDGNLVVASAKSRARRVYLRDGIYAEIELLYREGEFQPLPWTYADYRLADVLSFLNDVREVYLQQARESPRNDAP